MTTTIIKPTVGRNVWFHPSEQTGESGFARHQDGQPYAAIVARVWSDSLVNLSVFDANGVAHSRTSVELVQEGNAVPMGGHYCEWMPYQKGQAAKVDSMVKALYEGQQAISPGDRLIAPHQQRVLQEKTELDGRLSAQSKAMGSYSEILGERIAAFGETAAAGEPTTFRATEVSRGRDHIGLVLEKTPLPDLEREIQTKAGDMRWEPGKAPRVTQEMVDAQIVDETYTVLPSGRVTVCELTLQNGFTVRGESAVVFIENNVPEKGRQIARQKATDQIWQLLGFSLRDQLASATLTAGLVPWEGSGAAGSYASGRRLL